MADYLLYAKRYYGIEFSMFSFNESDLGIDVLHTPQEHADFIKEFGAYLAGLNLPTACCLATIRMPLLRFYPSCFEQS